MESLRFNYYLLLSSLKIVQYHLGEQTLATPAVASLIIFPFFVFRLVNYYTIISCCCCGFLKGQTQPI